MTQSTQGSHAKAVGGGREGEAKIRSNGATKSYEAGISGEE